MPSAKLNVAVVQNEAFRFVIARGCDVFGWYPVCDGGGELFILSICLTRLPVRTILLRLCAAIVGRLPLSVARRGKRLYLE